jgi:hypothetical protein
MPLITNAEVDRAGKARYSTRLKAASARTVLKEGTSDRPMSQEFDIFLSHSYQDAAMSFQRLLSIKAFLEDFNLSVYVDWIIDKHLDREQVSEQTAETLRHRMNHSKCLLFATSENSASSKWMPWELGYMDGKSQMVAILPLVEATGKNAYVGQEYLGIYPYIEKAPVEGTSEDRLWICKDSETYVQFSRWLKGSKPIKRR